MFVSSLKFSTEFTAHENKQHWGLGGRKWDPQSSWKVLFQGRKCPGGTDGDTPERGQGSKGGPARVASRAESGSPECRAEVARVVGRTA